MTPPPAAAAIAMAPSNALGAGIHGQAFRDLLSISAPQASEEIVMRAAQTLDVASGAEPLAAWLTNIRLRRTILRERRLGAPSNKIAEAQVHRNLCRAILGSLSTLWLIEGQIPGGETLDCVELILEGDEQRPAVRFSSVIHGDVEAFGAVVADVASRLVAIGQSPSGIAPALMESNGAIGLLAPYFILARHGIEARPLSSAIDAFLRKTAPHWRQAVRLPFLAASLSGAVEMAQPGRAVIRATCCAKYACGQRGFCGTCPKRLQDERA